MTRLGLGVGRYDKFVSLSQAPRVPDDADGMFEPLTPPNAWVSIRPILAASDGRTVDAQIEMRWHPQVSFDTRIVFLDPARQGARQTREFFVRGIENIDEQNQILRLLCEEIIP